MVMDDIEKNSQDAGQENIQLLEDRIFGKVIFYVQHTDRKTQFIFLYGYFMTLGVCMMQLYIESLISLVTALVMSLAPLLFVIYCEFTAVFSSGRILIMKVVLEQLLKDIECADLRTTEIDWRNIAQSANELSKKLGTECPLFYGKSHCIKYFREELVKPVENGTYCIRTFMLNEEREFFQEQCNRDLALRAVENYKLELQMNK